MCLEEEKLLHKPVLNESYYELGAQNSVCAHVCVSYTY